MDRSPFCLSVGVLTWIPQPRHAERSNGPVGNFSLIDVADIQLEFFLKLVEEVQDGDWTAFAPKSEAAKRFEAERVEATKNTVWVSGCDSWYLDDRGVPAAWPWSMQRFRTALREPDLDDFEFTA